MQLMVNSTLEDNTIQDLLANIT